MKDSDVFTTSTCININFGEFNYHSKPLSQDILFALPYLFLKYSIYDEVTNGYTTTNTVYSLICQSLIQVTRKQIQRFFFSSPDRANNIEKDNINQIFLDCIVYMEVFHTTLFTKRGNSTWGVFTSITRSTSSVVSEGGEEFTTSLSLTSTSKATMVVWRFLM